MRNKVDLDPEWLASESFTVSSVSVGFTAGTQLDLQYAHVTCETAVVRYWLDGSTPTATAGHELAAGASINMSNHLENVKFIRRDGADATLRVSYGR